MNVYDNRLTRYLIWRLFLTKPRFRVFLTKALIPDKDLDVRLFGATLRINRIKEIGYHRAAKIANSNIVFRDEVSVLLTLAMLLERGDTFVDVGANVGLYSSVLSRLSRVYPQNLWYAFEPNKDTPSRLAQSTAGLPVRIIEMGASSEEGQREFLAGAASGVFGVKEDASDFQFGKPVAIPMTTLDHSAIEGDRIVVKIDVEGHEIDVLRGGEKLIMSGRVKVVYLDGYGDRSIPGWLSARGFRLFDGRTLKESVEPEHSLLALHSGYFGQH